MHKNSSTWGTKRHGWPLLKEKEIVLIGMHPFIIMLTIIEKIIFSFLDFNTTYVSFLKLTFQTPAFEWQYHSREVQNSKR